jgi:hypothetical protein
MLLHDYASKTNHKKVSSFRKTPLVLRQAMGNLDSLDSPRPGLGGSHHLPPYNILCSSPLRIHPNDTFSWDSQSGVPKLSRFALPGLWASIIFCSDLRLRWAIGMRSEAILYLSSRAFQHHVTHYLQTSGLGRFPTFNGWESKCQFDSRPFFCP